MAEGAHEQLHRRDRLMAQLRASEIAARVWIYCAALDQNGGGRQNTRCPAALRRWWRMGVRRQVVRWMVGIASAEG